MPSAIRLAIFDMDDVLCHYDRDRRLAELSRLSGRSINEILTDIWASGFEDRADAGAMDAETYLAGFGERLGYAITRDEWVEARRLGMVPFPDSLDLLARVKEKATVAVLTNNGFLTGEEIDRLFPGLRRLVDDRVFVSARFGTKKPDPEIYRRLCAEFDVAPGAAFFTDDKPWNVEGAVKAGLEGHVFDGAEGLRRALTRLALV